MFLVRFFVDGPKYQPQSFCCYDPMPAFLLGPFVEDFPGFRVFLCKRTSIAHTGYGLLVATSFRGCQAYYVELGTADMRGPRDSNHESISCHHLWQW